MGLLCILNIVIFIGVICFSTKFCECVVQRNTAMAMSVKTNSGKAYIKYIEGDPDVWVDIIRAGGSQPIKDITKQNSLDNFKKLASCYHQRNLFWSNSHGREIEYGKLVLFSSSFSGSIKRVHYDSSIELGGMAVDWSANNLYWTDQLYHWILMAPLDDRRIFHIVVSDSLDKPGGIAVHPGKSYLFWTDYGSKSPKIEKSDLLGGNRQTIVSSGLIKPVAIDIDVSRDKLYWVDSGSGMIETSDLDGSQRNGLLQQSFVSTVVGLSLFKNHMFAVSSDSYLHLINITVPSNVKSVSLKRIYKTMYDVTTFSEVTQPQITSPCSSAGCSKMCVGTNDNTIAQCVCPWDMKLMPDGTSCSLSQYKTPPLYLYTTSPGKLCWYYVWAPDMVNNPLQINCDFQVSSVTAYTAIGYLQSKNHVYVGSETSIEMLVLKSGNNFQSFISNAGHVQGISVDWINEEIYWTTTDGFIKKSTINNSSDATVNTVMSSQTGISSILIEPFSKQMIWTITGSSPCIKKALDGSTPSTLVSTNILQPESLAFDYNDNRLYWVDKLKHTAESISLDGTDRKEVVNVVGSQPYGIAIFQDYIALTDQRSSFPSVQWYLKNGSGLVKSQKQNNIPGSIILYGEYSQPKNSSVRYTEVMQPTTLSTTPVYGGGNGGVEQPISTASNSSEKEESSSVSVNLLVIIVSVIVAGVFLIVIFVAIFLLIYCICIRRRAALTKSPEAPVIYTATTGNKVLDSDYSRLSRQQSGNEYYTDAMSKNTENGYPQEETYDTIDDKFIDGKTEKDLASPNEYADLNRSHSSTVENEYIEPTQNEREDRQKDEDDLNKTVNKDSEEPFYLTTESSKQV